MLSCLYYRAVKCHHGFLLRSNLNSDIYIYLSIGLNDKLSYITCVSWSLSNQGGLYDKLSYIACVSWSLSNQGGLYDKLYYYITGRSVRDYIVGYACRSGRSHLYLFCGGGRSELVLR